MNIKKEKVNTILVEYKDIANNNCYVSVTEWANGEGYDITVSSKCSEKTFILHYDEVMALNLGINALSLNLKE